MSCASTSSASATACRALTSRRCASSEHIGLAAIPKNRGLTRARARVSIRAGGEGDPPVPVAVRTSSGQTIDCMSALMMNRIIFIGDRIDENVATRVCAELLALQYDDPKKDIRIFLNCVNGTQYCVTTILDMMAYVSCDVSVIAMGCVAGPPAMILAGATKGKRMAYPSARIILSQPLGGLSGTSYEVRIQAKELSRNARMQVAFFAKFTEKPFEEIGEYLVRDSYMSPTEAIELNLIDSILSVNTDKIDRSRTAKVAAK
jgi:ATP-dependent Clp protease protease subunit|mmetsp:Transcript_1220/g.4028  ORF Transcript_1220/g.4028 Transcript_1220/m.4028 type:complete len:261 (-) Transcript_1220:89-871(-)